MYISICHSLRRGMDTYMTGCDEHLKILQWNDLQKEGTLREEHIAKYPAFLDTRIGLYECNMHV